MMLVRDDPHYIFTYLKNIFPLLREGFISVCSSKPSLYS